MSIVIDTPYSSTQGRKPSVPAFCFDFHNDNAGGTAVVDRFGNAANLALQGTLGASWTGSRGYWRPNGTDQHAITGTADEYAAQTVMADALLTSGRGLFVHYRLGWTGTKTAANEVALCLGRLHSSSAGVLVGVNNSGSVNCMLRGVGASANTSVSWGASGLTANATVYSMAVYLVPTTDGVLGYAWLNGVSAGTEQTLRWTNNGGATPAAAAFAMPDGITIGAQRAGATAGSPSWSQRVGGSTSGGTVLANVAAVNIPASMTTAGDLALEMWQYPRAVGEIMARL